MKKLHKLIVISYLGPFIMTFLIALFVLLMQFIWKYIDEFVGKGLEWQVVIKILLFASASLVPMALPLAILLSSIMTFGNLAEHYELVAAKAAGVSLQKIMAPLVIFAFCISGAAFFFSNNVLPYANLKFESLLYDIRQQKPALAIKEGAFYNGIGGYSIKVDKKDPDGSTIHGVMIYDHTEGVGSNKLIVAKDGRMLMSDDQGYLILNLYKGSSYEEANNIRTGNINSHPMVRNAFEQQIIRFDLSPFKLTRTNQELFKDNYQMMNIGQLRTLQDTLRKTMGERFTQYKANLGTYFFFRRDSAKKHISTPLAFKKTDFIENFERDEQKRIVETAINQARSVKSYIQSSMEDMDIKDKNLARNLIQWHLKFTLSIACLILFFIGAPLGAIIRKGGLGMPVVVSTAFFVVFHILSITGKKLAQEGTVPAWEGMWMASAVMFPIGAFLTIKATSESALFDGDKYRVFFQRFFKKKTQ